MTFYSVCYLAMRKYGGESRRNIIFGLRTLDAPLESLQTVQENFLISKNGRVGKVCVIA
jgi:hypothetical protein